MTYFIEHTKENIDIKIRETQTKRYENLSDAKKAFNKIKTKLLFDFNLHLFKKGKEHKLYIEDDKITLKYYLPYIEPIVSWHKPDTESYKKKYLIIEIYKLIKS